MPEQSIYEQHGYADRDDYLQSLADDNGVDIETVYAVADLLGEGEDFDGLVTSIQDM